MVHFMNTPNLYKFKFDFKAQNVKMNGSAGFKKFVHLHILFEWASNSNFTMLTLKQSSDVLNSTLLKIVLS